MEDTSMPLFTPIAPVRGRFKRKLTAAALLALTPVLAGGSASPITRNRRHAGGEV